MNCAAEFLAGKFKYLKDWWCKQNLAWKIHMRHFLVIFNHHEMVLFEYHSLRRIINPLLFGWLFMATFWLVFYPRGWWWYLGKFLMIYGLPSSLVVVMMRVATTKNTWFCFAPKKEVAWLLKPLSTKERRVQLERVNSKETFLTSKISLACKVS